MKKTFKLIIALFVLPMLAFTVSDGGKTCKVAGTTGTVECSAYAEGGTIIVDFGNDTDVDVNIKFTVKYVGVTENGKKSSEQSASRTKKVAPHSSSSMEIHTRYEELEDVKVSALSGNKCSSIE